MENFAKYVLEKGGDIHPLIIPANLTNGTGLMNPSVYNLDGKILVNIRHVNYTFYHSEKKLFQHPFGPLTYLHPENDMHLRTWNWYAELNDDFSIGRYNQIDTSTLDVTPIWDFVGLEDARLVKWEGKLYITGVRRDTTPNGQGRMELSEILVTPKEVKEISRVRIEPPKDPNSYCEKNWMPVIDQPYTFVKWSNPTEVVKVDPETGKSTTTHLTDYVQIPRDLRGGSQVIPFGDDGCHFAITHEVDLFASEVGRKDAVYRHRFVVWDKDWNIIKFTDDLSIMAGQVEFAVGMCEHNDEYLITFGYQDNAAFVLRTPKKVMEDFINEQN